jgi:hypothetical protein
MAGARGRGGGFDRRHAADEGERKGFAQRGERDGAGGVAGDDDGRGLVDFDGAAEQRDDAKEQSLVGLFAVG